MPQIVVGTAGHIDHGKTALVKALTGIDPDRLKEEKERGITIDLGFANLDIDEEIKVGFVDVPGHEKFVKNMLAGIGGIDVVMLVVAADESLMPQTREHLDICSLLHVKKGLTVISKIDTVEEEIVDLVELEVRSYLKTTFLNNAPIVRVSAHTGSGVPGLIDTLRSLCTEVKPKDTTCIFRMPVDRCFTMKGFGTVVTGTSISGSIQKDDEVEWLPTRRRTRIRGIQVHGKPSDVVTAGQRTALNLQGVEVSEIQRGTVMTQPGVFEAASIFDCHLDLVRSAPGPILGRKRIRFHSGTAEIMGHVSLLGQKSLEPGEESFAQIRLEKPIFALSGDRFIIRQYSPMVTIGGGTILEVGPKRHRRRNDQVLLRLRQLKGATLEDRLCMLIEDAGPGSLKLNQLVGSTGISPEAIQSVVDGLVQVGRIRRLPENQPTFILEKTFQEIVQRTLVSIEGFHESSPLSVGVSRGDLKNKVCSSAPNLVFQAVVEELKGRKAIEISKNLIHVFGRTVTFSATQELIKQEINKEFDSAGIKLLTPEELIKKLKLEPDTARKILKLMILGDFVVKVTDDLIIHREALTKLIGILRSTKGSEMEIGVGEFKDLFDLSRKHAIPLLEYLDRERVTRRVGDSRVILGW